MSAQEKSELITYRTGKKNANRMSRRKTGDGTRRGRTADRQAARNGHEPVTMSEKEKSEFITYRSGKKNVSEQEKSEFITYRSRKKNVNRKMGGEMRFDETRRSRDTDLQNESTTTPSPDYRKSKSTWHNKISLT
jgi:hypothetical protein